MQLNLRHNPINYQLDCVSSIVPILLNLPSVLQFGTKQHKKSENARTKVSIWSNWYQYHTFSRVDPHMYQSCINQCPNQRLKYTVYLFVWNYMAMNTRDTLFFMTEARNQVMEATERLGGQYSGTLHPKCTHLVVQISFSLFMINSYYLQFCLSFVFQ